MRRLALVFVGFVGGCQFVTGDYTVGPSVFSSSGADAATDGVGKVDGHEDGGSSGSGSSGSGSGGSDTCTADTSLTCDAGFDGYTCTGSATPDPAYICSHGSAGYCCITNWTDSMCVGDGSIAGCVYPSVGFKCSTSESPAASDTQLMCSSGSAEPNGISTDFCCQ
jgi:hypothetical protein